MDNNTNKQLRRRRRKLRVRRRLFGTCERPRLTVTRSLKHISGQIVDDDRGVTLCQASSLNKELRGDVGYGGNKQAAARVGAALAERAKAAGITAVAFDRNGYKYHGRVRQLAEAAREGGLQF